MSGYVAGLVWRAKIPGASIKEKAVLAHLADFAHNDGSRIFPAKSTIADETTLNRASVHRAIAWLLQSGILVEVKKGGGKSSDTTEYKIDLDLLRALHGDKGDGPQQRAIDDINQSLSKGSLPDTPIEGVAHSDPSHTATRRTQRRQGSHTATQPVMNPLSSETTSPRSRGAPSGWKEFWSTCNADMRRRSSQKQTETAWKRANKRVTAEKLLAALRRYLDEDPDVARGYGKGAHRWLNDARYEPWLEDDPATGWSDDQWRAALRLHERNGAWDPDWPPRERCPPHVAAEFTPRERSLFDAKEGDHAEAGG